MLDRNADNETKENNKYWIMMGTRLGREQEHSGWDIPAQVWVWAEVEEGHLEGERPAEL